ncbi:MAG: hypothetical protein ACRC80_18235 [Waterburya sp.]
MSFLLTTHIVPEWGLPICEAYPLGLPTTYYLEAVNRILLTFLAVL